MAEKCTFAAKEVSYLGHRVTSEGLLPDPTLLKAIREIGTPKNATEVRSFLCLDGYYRRYVKNFATTTVPLHALTRKDASSTGVWSVSKPSTASRPSSPPAQSLPSRTLTYRSDCTPMPQPQASELSSLKYKKARSASFVVPRAPLTMLRRYTPPLSWSASPSYGPSPSSVLT